jgi:hypothetical protein
MDLEISMRETDTSTNRLAVISLLFALLTFFSFCVGLAPFLVGSSILCYPAAFVFGTLALFSGGLALIQIRRSGEAGRWMALSGIMLGGLTVLATICAIMLTLWLGAAFITQLLLDANATPTLIPSSTP